MNLLQTEPYNNTLSKRFTFNRLVGSGSFSSVYSVYDKLNARTVALKINKNNCFKNNCFKNEISILSKLRSKEKNNIVKILESFTYDSNEYIILKMYNISLKEYIQCYESTIEKTRLIAREINNGLIYLKKNNIIHCDIKPENILFKDNTLKQIVIIDFGISLTLDKKQNKVTQTIYYRAPEVLLGDKYNSKIDIWSLGCVIYEIFYKIPLFPYKKTDELFLNQNILLDHPSYDFIKKYTKIHTFYDNIENPAYLVHKGIIYAFKHYKFLEMHKEKSIIELVLTCCEWDPQKRPFPEELRL
tara:strand:+ start:3357 stop:4259 length:903 start_codon:yes stop_codon:yes gene_type:complete